MTDHLPEHHPISDAQWGFQKGKSTLTAHDWLKNWMRVLCILLPEDLGWCSPHKNYGKTETALFASLIVTRLCSYLTKHRRSVVINGASLLSILDFCCTPGLGFRAVTPIMTAFLHLIFLKVVKFLSMQMTCFSLKTSLQAGFCQTAGKHRSDLWLVYFKTNEDKLQLQAVHPCKKFAECTNYPAIHNLLVSN